MDTIFQALSGLMTTPGNYGDPPVRNAVPFGDLIGPLFGVIGTLSALLMRERTGQGQHVDVALLGALTSLIATEPWDTMERAGIEMRTGNVVPRLAPFGIFDDDRRQRRAVRPDRRLRARCLRRARQPRARAGRALLEPRPQGGELGGAARADRGLGGGPDERRGDRRARRERRSGGGRSRHRDRGSRPARAPAAARRCSSRTRGSGRSTSCYGSGFPVKLLRSQRRLRDAAAVARRAQRFRSRRRCSATRPSGSKLSGPPALSNPPSTTSQSKAVCGTPGRSGERQEPEESAAAEESGPPGEYQAT